MLGLFFQKTDTFSVVANQMFLRVSNNLDSHYYVLQKVKSAGSHYFIDHYFENNHSQIISYLTSWSEKQAIIEQQSPIIKKVKQQKDKKGILGGLLNKKKQSETSNKMPIKQHKEEPLPTSFQDVLYIQLQSFTELNLPTDLADIKNFMALVYLLAMRVFDKFQIWPQMIPVITQSKHYKFLKKGKELQHQLVKLFEYITKQQKINMITQWSPDISQKYSTYQNQYQKIKFLGDFLQNQLQTMLRQEFKLKLKKTQEIIMETVIIQDSNILFLKQSGLQLVLQEYDIFYYHQDSQTRQIIMQHNIQNTLVLEGNRNNLVIRYLKQFVKG